MNGEISIIFGRFIYNEQVTMNVFFNGGNLLKRMSKKNRKPILLFVIILLFVAGLLDIKYEGLFFQLLPHSIQSYLAKIL